MAPRFFTKRLSPDDERFFIQQLMLMLKVGISVPRALELLSVHSAGPRYRNVLEDIREDVIAGNPLGRSLKGHPGLFDPTMADLVHIGELKGDLHGMFQNYLVMLDSRERVKKKMRAALTYPSIVVVAMIGIGILASLFIFPQMKDLFSNTGMELPLATRIVLGVSAYMDAYGFQTFAAAAAVVLAGWLFFRSKAGRPLWHRIILRIPVAGRLAREKNMTAIMRNTSILLEAGMPILAVLEAVAGATKHAQYKASLFEAMDEVRKGNPLHKMLLEHPELYPRISAELVAVGEETGSLRKVCADIADHHEQRMFTLLDLLPAVIEPAIIFLVAGGVATIAVAILLPMYRFAGSI